MNPPDPLVVLYQDDELVAVDKPSGLIVHRTYLDRQATAFALQQLRDQLGRHVYPVNRLDKPASGVLLFALDPDAARRAAEAYADKAVEKTYLVVARGHPPDRGRIDRPLKPLRDKRFEAHRTPADEALPAITDFRTLARSERPFSVGRYPTSRYALVEATTRTGRYHQVRRHLNHIHHPVIGDNRHGDYRHNRYVREQLGCARLLLHAAALSMIHPYTGAPLRIEAPIPHDFAAAMEALGLAGEGL